MQIESGGGDPARLFYNPPMPSRPVLLLPCLLALAAPASADIYAYTDAGGVVHFSNVPDNGSYALVMRTPDEKTAAPAVSGPNAPDSRSRFAPLVEEAAIRNQLDAALLHAMIRTESGYNPRAVSRKGAMGLMQLMPGTASRYGVSDAFDPAQNVRGGARYLSDLLQAFNQDLNLALAAYNAGENAVIRHGNRIPPYRETLAYVPKVLDHYRKLRAAAP